MTNYIWQNIFRNSSKERGLQSKLKTNFLFQDLSFAEIAMLEKIVNVRNYRPGEIIFRQGEVGVGMYIIAKGLVNIYVEEIVPASGELKTTHVTQLRKSDFFGDLALVENNGRRSASALAHEETTLIGFFKPDLLEITNRRPSAGVKILLRLGEVLGARLKETTNKITEMKKSALADSSTTVDDELT